MTIPARYDPAQTVQSFCSNVLRSCYCTLSRASSTARSGHRLRRPADRWASKVRF